MEITQAKKFMNASARLSWTDRNGDVVTEEVYVLDVNFVPFYGPCFITNQGDIRLDRVVACAYAEKRAA